MNAASRPQPAPEAPGEHPLGAAFPETDPPVRVRLDFAYDGAPFSGWARQPGLTTVQGCLEDALQLVLLGLLFSAPLVMAAVLYFVAPEWQPEGRTNYGELIRPAQPTEDRPGRAGVPPLG